MYLWVDDVRSCPSDIYEHAKSVQQAEIMIARREEMGDPYELLDLDHDAGDYVKKGGDYIKLLDWLEATKKNYPIRIHSMNPVGVQNMRAIIQKNNWIEVR